MAPQIVTLRNRWYVKLGGMLNSLLPLQELKKKSLKLTRKLGNKLIIYSLGNTGVFLSDEMPAGG